MVKALKSIIVLILIFLENALRHVQEKVMHVEKTKSLNPYFFGKCSTASIRALTNQLTTIATSQIFIKFFII